MSVVTNCILAWMVGGDNPRILREVNRFFSEQGFDRAFVSVEPLALKSGKALEVELALGAFNHLDLDALVAHLRTKVDWEEFQEDVQLIVKEQEDTSFTVIRIFDCNRG